MRWFSRLRIEYRIAIVAALVVLMASVVVATVNATAYAGIGRTADMLLSD